MLSFIECVFSLLKPAQLTDYKEPGSINILKLKNERYNLAIPMTSKECSIVLDPESRLASRNELLIGVHNKYAISTLSDKIDANVMYTAGSALKVISFYST